jgi:hypothetical protein
MSNLNEDPSTLVQAMMYEQITDELNKDPKNDNLILLKKKIRRYICRYYDNRQEKRYTQPASLTVQQGV